VSILRAHSRPATVATRSTATREHVAHYLRNMFTKSGLAALSDEIPESLRDLGDAGLSCSDIDDEVVDVVVVRT
jgi:uncharacterized protein YjiS (DUF1127 family)